VKSPDSILAGDNIFMCRNMTYNMEKEAEARHKRVTEDKLDLFMRHFLPELKTTSSNRTARDIYR
jgi:hypothetical protein